MASFKASENLNLYHDIDKALFDIWRRVWNLRWLRPANLKEEEKRFFKSDIYEPKFCYEPLDFDSVALRKRLNEMSRSLDYDDHPLAILLKAKIKKLNSWIAMLAALGTPDFSEHSRLYYGVPDDDLLDDAKRLLTTPVRLEESKEELLGTERAVEMLQEEANRLGIDCTVKAVEGLASRADCVLPERTLYLRRGALFSERDIRKLTVHELGVHARRALQGLKQPYKLFFMGTAEYETTEEGLAGLMEKRAGVANDLKVKGALVLAVNSSLKNGFRAVYSLLLRKNFSPERSFRLTLRVKRGLGDTSKPGAFTKDLIYLKGFRMVEHLSEDQLKALFIGRVAVEDSGLLERMKELKLVV